jgi:hypothetical protein
MMPFTFQPLTNHHKTFLDTAIYFYYSKSELNIETTFFVSLRVPLDSICLLRLKNMKEQYYLHVQPRLFTETIAIFARGLKPKLKVWKVTIMTRILKYKRKDVKCKSNC